MDAAVPGVARASGSARGNKIASGSEGTKVTKVTKGEMGTCSKITQKTLDNHR